MKHRNAGVILFALCISSVALSGCGSHGSSTRTPRKLWTIGPFHVRRLNTPYRDFSPGGEALLGSGTELRIRGSGPYMVLRRTDGVGPWHRVATLSCASHPRWTSIDGPEAELLCLGGAQESNQLFAIPPSGPTSAYDIPVRVPTPLPVAFGMGGMAIGGSKGRLLWSVGTGVIPPVTYGSGYLNMATGQESSVPSQILTQLHREAMLLSPNDTLYQVSFSTQSGQSIETRWSTRRSTWVQVGTFPTVFGPIMGISDGGGVWARLQATKNPLDIEDWYVVYEVPGSPRVEKWRIHGNLLGIGPGYAVYIPFSDSQEVNILFPLQHRTLRFRGLTNPYPGALQVGDIGVPAQFGTDSEVVAVGHGFKTEELVVSTK